MRDREIPGELKNVLCFPQRSTARHPHLLKTCIYRDGIYRFCMIPKNLWGTFLHIPQTRVYAHVSLYLYFLNMTSNKASDSYKFILLDTLFTLLLVFHLNLL